MHYPSDPATHGIETQFFYGPSLLVSPVTEADSTSVTFYLPNDLFYDLFTLQQIQGTGGTITYNDVDVTEIPVHIRGGSIIPARVNSAMTIKDLRDEDFELIIAPNKDGKAFGTLYLDDGESEEQDAISEIEFTFEDNTISMDGSFDYPTQQGVLSVTVLGKDGATRYELNEGLDGPWEHDLSGMKGASAGGLFANMVV
jgi:alpha-glucosidase